MEDKELLEKAAKAYWGEEIDDVCSIRWLEDECGIGYTHGDNQDHNGIDREFLWNPLTEDGDALRLAVKLGIQIDPSDEMYVFAGRDMDTTELGYCECKNDDAMAAIRRAITRAAAAMVND